VYETMSARELFTSADEVTSAIWSCADFAAPAAFADLQFAAADHAHLLPIDRSSFPVFS